MLGRCVLGHCVLGRVLGTLCLGTLCLGTLCLGTLCLGTLCVGTVCLGTLIVGFMLVAVKERLADIVLVAPEDLGSAPRGQQFSWWQCKDVPLPRPSDEIVESVDTKFLQFLGTLRKHVKQLQKGFWVAVNAQEEVNSPASVPVGRC